MFIRVTRFETKFKVVTADLAAENQPAHAASQHAPMVCNNIPGRPGNGASSYPAPHG